MSKKSITFAIVALILLGMLFFAYGLFFAVFYPLKYRDTVYKYSAQYDIAPALVFSVINTESHFRPQSVSKAGAVGLMQIMPSTGAWLAEETDRQSFVVQDLQDPEVNIALGVYYLKYLSQKFPSQDAMLAAYNAGEGTVSAWLDSEEYAKDGELTRIPYPETANYIKKVNRSLKIYKGRLR